MNEEFLVRPIAHIQTDFQEKFGIPRQSGRVAAAEGRIVFLPPFRHPDAVRGIDGFSHLWLIFDFSASHRAKWIPAVRPPRLGGNRRVGVFASRSPFRPNPFGLSSVRLQRVEWTKNEGAVLIVSGVDLLNGTPILDIKPYLPFTDAHPDAACGYTKDTWNHRLKVRIPPEMEALLPPDMRALLRDVLAEDPRPSYQDDPRRIYHLLFRDWEIHFQVIADSVRVIGMEKCCRKSSLNG